MGTSDLDPKLLDLFKEKGIPRGVVAKAYISYVLTPTDDSHGSACAAPVSLRPSLSAVLQRTAIELLRFVTAVNMATCGSWDSEVSVFVSATSPMIFRCSAFSKTTRLSVLKEIPDGRVREKVRANRIHVRTSIIQGHPPTPYAQI